MEDSDITNSAVSPPPIPSAAPEYEKAGWWAWPVILVAVAYIVFTVQNPPAAVEAGKKQIAPATELVMLQLQGKMVVGLALIDSEEGQKSVDQLEPTVMSDSTAVAVAALHRFINHDGKGMEKAEATLDSRRESPDADLEFLENAWKSLAAGISETERETWTTKLAWFASIFPEDAEGNVPNRSQIQTQGIVTVGLMMLGMLAAFIGGVAGLIMLIIALAKRSNGKFTTRFESFSKPAGIFLEAFAIYIGLMAVADLVGVLWMKSAVGAVLLPVLFVAAFILGLLWPVIRGIRWKNVRRQLGLHRGQGIGRELFAGFVGYLAMLPVTCLGMIITLLLMLVMGLDVSGSPQTDETAGTVPEAPSHPAAEWVALGDWKMKLLIFVLAAIIAPLFEETMFRGALFRAFRSRWRFLVSALIGGFIFAIIHPQGWLAAPALTAMGVGFAMIREWRDSLIAPMTAHAINNGLIVGGLILIL